MFSYLRYFAIISLIVVIGASTLIGFYFRSIASGNLLETTERSSISLSQSFINTTWVKHLPNLRRLAAIDPSLWGKYKEFRAFSEDTFRQFEGVPITQLNIYTPEGVRVLTISQDAEFDFTSDAAISQLPQDDDTRRGFDAALKGNVASNIIENRTFKARSGNEVHGTVVQSFVPILPDSFVPLLAGAAAPKTEGIIEVFYDITPQWSQLYLFQVLGSGGIMIIFVVLIGALFFTSRKAESIITTQHETNVELAATAAKAEAESRQKSQFLANVSHELRTPLNAIIGFSEIIKNEVMGALGNEQYMNYIRDIHSSGVHLLSLINDILDFSKAEAGKLELQLSELDATKLIKNCMRLVSPRAEEMGVQLTTEVPKEHFIITGDAKKLKQVLLNLLSNSVKFTPQGGEVKVTAWQNVMDDSIAIEVKDSGIGIAPKDISRAMSPFGQVDSALSRKYEGTGLGLPLTKKFVEIMGGTFKIESELNVGTTITITVPLTPPKHVMRAANKIAEEIEEGKREKQISPALANAAAQASADLAMPTPSPSLVNPISAPQEVTPTPAPTPSTAPIEIELDYPAPIRSPATEETPAPVAAAPATPFTPTPGIFGAKPAGASLFGSSNATPQAPVRSLVAGMRPAEEAAHAPAAEPLYDAPSYEAPAVESPSFDTPYDSGIPATEEPEPAPLATPAPESGQQKFMSFADLKKMGKLPE